MLHVLATYFNSFCRFVKDDLWYSTGIPCNPDGTPVPIAESTKVLPRIIDPQQRFWEASDENVCLDAINVYAIIGLFLRCCCPVHVR